MTVQNTIRFLIWWHPPELFFSSVKLNFSERSLTHHRDISWPFVVKGVTGFLIGHTRGVWRGVELWKRDLCHCFFSRTSLFLVRHPFQRGFNQTMDMELKITNYKYNNMVLQSPLGVETASFDICLKLFVVLILQFAGFQLKPHIRSFPDTQCAVTDLYWLFVREAFIYVLAEFVC